MYTGQKYSILRQLHPIATPSYVARHIQLNIFLTHLQHCKSEHKATSSSTIRGGRICEENTMFFFGNFIKVVLMRVHPLLQPCYIITMGMNQFHAHDCVTSISTGLFQNLTVQFQYLDQHPYVSWHSCSSENCLRNRIYESLIMS